MLVGEKILRLLGINLSQHSVGACSHPTSEVVNHLRKDLLAINLLAETPSLLTGMGCDWAKRPPNPPKMPRKPGRFLLDHAKPDSGHRIGFCVIEKECVGKRQPLHIRLATPAGWRATKPSPEMSSWATS
jgi:hypothetical protein